MWQFYTYMYMHITSAPIIIECLFSKHMLCMNIYCGLHTVHFPVDTAIAEIVKALLFKQS